MKTNPSFNLRFAITVCLTAFVFLLTSQDIRAESICTNVPADAADGVMLMTNVVAGQTYAYTAWGCVANNTGCGSVCNTEDPDGNIFNGPACSNSSFYTNNTVAASNFICPGLIAQSLVGKINGGPCIQLGTSGTFTAATSGVLVVYFNDDNFVDNTGSWNVCITPTNAPACATITELLARIQTLDLKKGTKDSLAAKLSLRSFVREVRALKLRQRLDASTANALIDYAESISPAQKIHTDMTRDAVKVLGNHRNPPHPNPARSGTSPLPQTTGARGPEANSRLKCPFPSPLSCKGEGQGEGFPAVCLPKDFTFHDPMSFMTDAGRHYVSAPSKIIRENQKYKIMKAKQIWANLATNDLARTTKFYTELGFNAHHSNTSHASELTSISFGENDFIINFFLKNALQNNTHSKIADLKNGNEIIISLSAESKKEVNDWVELVKKAGGTIAVEPYEIGLGYTFVFSDPDGHKFNVLYWPGM